MDLRGTTTTLPVESVMNFPFDLILSVLVWLKTVDLCRMDCVAKIFHAPQTTFGDTSVVNSALRRRRAQRRRLEQHIRIHRTCKRSLQVEPSTQQLLFEEVMFTLLGTFAPKSTGTTDTTRMQLTPGAYLVNIELAECGVATITVGQVDAAHVVLRFFFVATTVNHSLREVEVKLLAPCDTPLLLNAALLDVCSMLTHGTDFILSRRSPQTHKLEIFNIFRHASPLATLEYMKGPTCVCALHGLVPYTVFWKDLSFGTLLALKILYVRVRP